MTFPSHDIDVSNPTSNGSPLLSGRSAAHFYVTPMGNGRPAKMVEKEKPEEDDPIAGMGFSILGSVIGGALGLGPMFEIAFEAVKMGMEVAEGQVGSTGVVEDVNLNPAALLDPSRAFNFKALADKRMSTYGSNGEEDVDEAKRKRTWNSGESDYMLASRIASKRHNSVSANPVLQMKGFGVSSSGKK